MTWSNVPGGPPQSSPSGPGPSDAQRAAWERGGTTLFPPGKLADRISTVLLLAFGAVMTIVTAVVGIIAVISATASCDTATGCSPGAYIGGTAIAVGGSFVIGVATLVLAIGAWIRRRSSWWIAAVGFVLAIVVITWGGVVFAGAADSASGSSSVSSTA
ncbi:hypothetical protein GCM10017714_30600 [Curtobacterium pusillum]|uniref:Uncharacterized protein n=1 Tax=Curtobacterium pusillum TaxID=69373 RepID=A0ABX2MD05_9MICO|nr:DUF6264 family protein [Curtobacterium pusillum]NUU13556.1 hypothetical protein [Curtobacterium pusillum]GLK32143.1 hypothetical protein GCM10017610_24280 [Curtobacterium pusillum]